MVNALREVQRHLFAYANTYGDMGDIADWQQHSIVVNFEQLTAKLEEWIGEKFR